MAANMTYRLYGTVSRLCRWTKSSMINLTNGGGRLARVYSNESGGGEIISSTCEVTRFGNEGGGGNLSYYHNYNNLVIISIAA